MTWLCPRWIVGLYSVWISWWLHCEGLHSLRSVYPAAGASPELPCSGAGYSTTDCGKEKGNELKKNKAKKKSCWKCCICYGMAVCMRGLIPWVAVSRCSCWDQCTQGLYITFSGKNHVGGPNKCAIFLHSSDLVDFSNWKKGSIGVCVPIPNSL